MWPDRRRPLLPQLVAKHAHHLPHVDAQVVAGVERLLHKGPEAEGTGEVSVRLGGTGRRYRQYESPIPT